MIYIQLEKNGDTHTMKKNYKNIFQTLAMANVCVVCEKLLRDAAMYSDVRIKGFIKWFWRSRIGKIIKYCKVREKF